MKMRIITFVLACLYCVPIHAQEYPTRTIAIYCGFPAGSGSDVIVRYFADKMRPLAGQPVVVENKVGALGNIAADAMNNAKPDGYTMLITPNSAGAANVHTFKQLPFDPRAFTPVTTLVQLPFVLIVGPNSSVKSVAELTAAMKAKNGKGTFGYANTTALASAEMYRTMAGFEATPVAYRGVPQSIADLTQNELDFTFADATFATPQIEQGLFRGLAVTTRQRSSALPNLPTMAETGLTGYDLGAWFAAFLPPHTPPQIAQKLSDWLNQIMAMPETKKFLLNVATDTFPGSPEALRKFQAAEIDKWGIIVKAAKIEPQ
jgi:tripartite-type tricarboxylate transporter receptor subunit TctC